MHKQQQRQGAAAGASTTGQAREAPTAGAERHAAWSWAADGGWMPGAGMLVMVPEQRRWLVAQALQLRTSSDALADMLELMRTRGVSTSYGRDERDPAKVRRWLQACWQGASHGADCWCGR